MSTTPSRNTWNFYFTISTLFLSTFILAEKEDGKWEHSNEIAMLMAEDSKQPDGSSFHQSQAMRKLLETGLEYERKQKSFRFGPRINDWDKTRAKLIKGNPGINLSHDGKNPRVMIVTAADAESCDTPLGNHISLKFAKNKMDYARVKNYEIYYSQGVLRPDFDIYWSKLPLMRSLMLAHPEVEWFWWIDSDAMITDMVFDIPWKKYANKTFVVNGWPHMVYRDKDWTGANSGSFFLRNNLKALDFLDEWGSYGVKGEIRHYWGKIFSDSLKTRPPNYDADDQAALVWIMIQKRKELENDLFIENTFCLHSWWIMVVDKYEEMMAKSHPGIGNENWPFVTHFVGCKTCRATASYDFEKCRVNIERAFHFADNQILQPYGYRHKSLTNGKIVKTA